MLEKELDQNEYYYTRDTAYSGHKTVEQINADRNIKETQDKFRYQQDTKAGDHVYNKFENQPDRCRNKFDKTEKGCANQRNGHYYANIHSFVPIPTGIKLQFIFMSHADNKLGQKNRAQREKAPEIICINMDTSKTEFCQAAGYFLSCKRVCPPRAGCKTAARLLHLRRNVSKSTSCCYKLELSTKCGIISQQKF